MIDSTQILSRQLAQKTAAEMLGVFALIFCGCGAAISNEIYGGMLGHVGVSLAFGLVVLVMIYATGHISGAHFNPAVTLAFAMAGRFSWREVPFYLSGQFLAALTASLALSWIFESPAAHGVTSVSISLSGAFVLEVILSFFLMFVIMAVATDSRAMGQMAGLAIGGTVALMALFAGPLTGASMNPARSFGPALVSGSTEHLWLYFAAPTFGAVFGAFVYKFVSCSEGSGRHARGCC